MLVLTRRPNESIVINDNIIVTVLGVSGNQVRVGVKAPKDVGIDRQEIWERKKAEKAA